MIICHYVSYHDNNDLKYRIINKTADDGRFLFKCKATVVKMSVIVPIFTDWLIDTYFAYHWHRGSLYAPNTDISNTPQIPELKISLQKCKSMAMWNRRSLGRRQMFQCRVGKCNAFAAWADMCRIDGLQCALGGRDVIFSVRVAVRDQLKLRLANEMDW